MPQPDRALFSEPTEKSTLSGWRQETSVGAKFIPGPDLLNWPRTDLSLNTRGLG